MIEPQKHINTVDGVLKFSPNKIVIVTNPRMARIKKILPILCRLLFLAGIGVLYLSSKRSDLLLFSQSLFLIGLSLIIFSLNIFIPRELKKMTAFFCNTREIQSIVLENSFTGKYSNVTIFMARKTNRKFKCKAEQLHKSGFLEFVRQQNIPTHF